MYQSGMRKRESKLLQQRITALTALQRRRKPDDDGSRPPLEIDPATVQMMEQLANTELPTVDDRFDKLLVKYVHETAGMKESILEDITDQELTGQAKLDNFIDKMEASTSPLALQKAMWMGIQRQGQMEQPAAYATRFRKAADHCGRSKADINEKFTTTLFAPWDNEPALKGFKAQVEGKHVVQIQDDEALLMVLALLMAETAFSFETMVIQRTVIQMERDGTCRQDSHSDGKGRRPVARHSHAQGPDKAKARDRQCSRGRWQPGYGSPVGPSVQEDQGAQLSSVCQVLCGAGQDSLAPTQQMSCGEARTAKRRHYTGPVWTEATVYLL